MVRTKADAATRVAAGGKAPKKTANRASESPAPGSDRGAKDGLPGNRYCPRETPTWQKKITFFYNRNDVEMDESGSTPDNTRCGEEKIKQLDDSAEMETKERSSTIRVKDEKITSTEEFEKDEYMEMDE